MLPSQQSADFGNGLHATGRLVDRPCSETTRRECMVPFVLVVLLILMDPVQHRNHLVGKEGVGNPFFFFFFFCFLFFFCFCFFRC